jgi:membrane-bound lytic murein transglycosylase B
MSNTSRLHTIKVPLRRLSSALPAIALLGGGVALSAPAAPAHNGQAIVAAKSPAIVVPDTALTWPSRILDDLSPLAGASAPEAPAGEPLAPVVAAADTPPGSTALVTLDSTGIPVRALQAYRQAAALTDKADPSCNIDWALVAAIGRVESNHARFGGNQLDAAGVAQPGIIGIALDGTNGTARITDTDRGVLDRDTVYDRAVGPMQFIPGSWRVGGVDGNGDGVKNPQNMADAAASTAVYLCSGPGDLGSPADLRSAILRYNASDSYAQMVTAIADAYRHGVSAIPATDLPTAKPAAVASAAVKPATKTAAVIKPAVPRSVAATIKPTVAPPAPAPSTSATASPAPTTTAPATTTPTTTPPSVTTTTTASAAPASTTTAAPACVPAPTPSGVATPSGTPSGTVTPVAPCVPTPCTPAAAAAAAAATPGATPAVCTTPAPTATP